MISFRLILSAFILTLFLLNFTSAQFMDSFDNGKIKGWFTLTGDGKAKLDFIQKDDYARMLVDATEDNYNVYWTLIKRDVTSSLNLAKLDDPDFELRVEARIKVSVAPRRVNFMINTNRTTDFHEHLREFDIADTAEWHVISMTTKDFDAVPGDTVYVQLCATDFGLGKYHVDVDYYKADIININEVEGDKGEPLPYHPKVPEINEFGEHLRVDEDCPINRDFANVNFNNWYSGDQKQKNNVLTINNDQWAILKWNFSNYKNMKIAGPGVLELKTAAIQKGGDYIAYYGEDFGIEFGKLRIIEIIGGPDWDEQTVTYNKLMQGNSYASVFNEQMIFDTEVNETKDGSTYITISRPVMQRLLDGKTKGILLRPLGAVDISIYASENAGKSAELHFNIEE